MHSNPLPDPAHAGNPATLTTMAPHEGEEELERSCPFCGAADSEVISLFGSQVMTMQYKCRACGSFFEASKY